MEVVQEEIKYLTDYSSINVSAYNIKNITDLEEGTIFGILVSKYDMDVIYPLIDFVDGNLKYCLSTSLTSFSNPISKKFKIDSDVLNCEYGLPLIFKKLNDNLAEELLSKETFIISRGNIYKKDDINNLDVGLEKFQKDVEKYSDNNVIIYVKAKEFCSDRDVNCFFVVDDRFKYLYSRETLSKREEVIKILKTIKQQSKTYFEDKYKEIVSVGRSIADTENLIYDTEHAEYKIKIMQRK